MKTATRYALVFAILLGCNGNGEDRVETSPPADDSGVPSSLDVEPGPEVVLPADPRDFDRSTSCEPYATVCIADRFSACLPHGRGWRAFQPCWGDGVCYSGKCGEPECKGKTCGDNSCGGTCGTCSVDEECIDDQCYSKDCAPDCADKVCGPDGCGGFCGECPDSEITGEQKECYKGICKGVCSPGDECDLPGIQCEESVVYGQVVRVCGEGHDGCLAKLEMACCSGCDGDQCALSDGCIDGPDNCPWTSCSFNYSACFEGTRYHCEQEPSGCFVVASEVCAGGCDLGACNP